MTFKEYQTEAIKTAIYGEGNKVIYPALGLVGEAGEVANKVKKVLRDDGGVLSPQKADEVAKEIGDVLWYIAALCNDIGVDMEEIATVNIAKLKDRQARGVIGGSGDKR
jgi:NTP pyrophosphatase (non-canonical NTP hydrolase)